MYNQLNEDQLKEMNNYYSYNGLSFDQFVKFCDYYSSGQSMLFKDEDYDSLMCDCPECGKFYPPEYGDSSQRRCSCDNRRCYIIYDEAKDYFYCEVD